MSDSWIDQYIRTLTGEKFAKHRKMELTSNESLYKMIFKYMRLREEFDVPYERECNCDDLI